MIDVRRRRAGPALRVALALGALLAAAALLLPATLRLPLLVALAFVAGTALERYRHSLPRPPPTLRATPAAWRTAVGQTVGWSAALLAILALVGAAGVLFVPQDRAPSNLGAVRAPAPATPLPTVPVRHERLGHEFQLGGASFRVWIETAAPWARQIHHRPAGRGRRWLTIAVLARNLRRPRFDPTRLAYRLRDARGTSFVGTFRGGTGPRSLSQHGSLRRGQAARIQLGFRLPVTSWPVALVFEDRAPADGQVQVALRRPTR